MNKKCTYRLLVLLLMVFSSIEVLAQVSPSELSYPYNHLQWYTIEGEHFFIHYQEGNEKTAAIASVITNEIFKPITDLYDYRPDRKVSVVLHDRQDYANGAAYFFDDKIDIWIPPLDTPLRGTHQWLRNVITHEFTHIVQMGASMKRSPTIQSIYFQWLSYEDVRRPDVLYGSPKGIITHPLSTVSIPAWFSEGTAQYMRENIFFDYWDTHRDMILRMNIINDKILGFEEMGDFSSKNSLEREMVYNQGFDFVRYLTEQFGEDVIADLSKTAAEGSNDFSKVMESVTGRTGQILYHDWIQNRREKYSLQVQNIVENNIKTVVEDGFMNFYPQYDRQGNTFGYLTNRDRDYATTLLVLETPDSTIVVDELESSEEESSNHSNTFDYFYESNIALDQIGNRFSFSPDGKKVTYSKADKNRFGEEYQDLFLFDIERLDENKITADGRIQDPAWHPSDNKIVAVELQNGTQNLVLVEPESNKRTKLTHFENGETVYTPVWSPDGQYVYFSSAKVNNRNLYRFNVESGQVQTLLEDPFVDFRDPWMDQNNQYLYFSSDLKGIFNIYRSEIDGQSFQIVTDVRGGAFMPFATADSLYFSEYRSDGYKISSMKLPEFKPTHSSNETLKNSSHHPIQLSDIKLEERSIFDKTQNFSTVHDSLKTLKNEEKIILSTENNEYSFLWRPYSHTTTGLSVIPVIRFDNYSKQYGSNSRLLSNGKFGDVGKNLVRDLKAGAYFTSRDVTERLNIFAGALFGFGSTEAASFTDFFSPTRLNNLDRDLFLMIDHQGIPFIKRSWSPTISVELYNLKRNVRDGASIEEFPCTSCLPVQKSIDIRYNVWEASLYLRSKLNQWSLLELGASYSPYSVATDGFFSNEINEFIPGSTTEYFKGTSYSLSYIANTIVPTRHSDIAPEGARANATIQVENGRLLQEFELNEGSLSPIYNQSTNYSLELQSQLGGEIAGDVNGLITSRVFSYFSNPEDYFYLDYAGGLSGMQSYPYFAVGGQRTIWGRFSLLAPLKRDINRQMGAYTLDKLYANLFFEAGNGWGGPLNIGDNLKTGMGTELRFALNSYYIFPLKFFLTATYGFNQFNVTLPDQFISISSENSITYGKELLFYFGLTFDFNQL